MHRRLLRNFLRGLVGAVVLTIVISLFTTATATPRLSYTVTDLGTLSSYPLTKPFRINDAGQVVGGSQTNSAYPLTEHAFLSQNGQITDLGTLGSKISRAFDINNKEQIVGRSYIRSDSSGEHSHAFLWQNAQMTDLGTYSSDNSSTAVGINNSGQVVGWSYKASGSQPYPIDPINETWHAVLWRNGGLIDLGTLSGDNFSQAFNINNRGQIFGWSRKVVGSIFADKTAHIFQWKNGTMTNLGNLITPSDYGYSNIARINNKGQVVGGFSSVNPLTSAAFFWQDGNLIDLGNLGGMYTEAIDINEVGTVVGVSYISTGTSHAFIWRNGKMRDLNNFLPPNSGWELNYAAGISNKGQIVGGGKLNGQYRGFLLTPVTTLN
jgi:probable HAF family extracellular repeat protein